MKGKIRRQDRQTSIELATELFENGEYGVLSLCSPDSEGYGIPLNYVFDGDKLYFHCATEGTKLDYLRACCKASFCVVGETRVLPEKFGTLYRSAIATGQVSEVDGYEKRESLFAFVRKYSAGFEQEGAVFIDNLIDKVVVLKLVIESMTGKAREY